MSCTSVVTAIVGSARRAQIEVGEQAEDRGHPVERAVERHAVLPAPDGETPVREPDVVRAPIVGRRRCGNLELAECPPSDLDREEISCAGDGETPGQPTGRGPSQRPSSARRPPTAAPGASRGSGRTGTPAPAGSAAAAHTGVRRPRLGHVRRRPRVRRANGVRGPNAPTAAATSEISASASATHVRRTAPRDASAGPALAALLSAVIAGVASRRRHPRVERTRRADGRG